MGSIDFQNGFIAGVSTQGAFPLGLRGFKEEDEGKFLKVEDGKVGLAPNIELSRVVPETDGNKAIIVEDGKIVLTDKVPFEYITADKDYNNRERGVLLNWDGEITSGFLGKDHLKDRGNPGQLVQIGDDYHLEAVTPNKVKRHILLIGDSYGEGCGSLDSTKYWNGGVRDEENKTWKNMTTWITHVKHNFGMGIWGFDQLDCFENVAISHVSSGGAGFINKGPVRVNGQIIEEEVFGFFELASCISSGTGSYNSYYPATWHIANTKVPVTDVVILGGYNDIHYVGDFSAEDFNDKLREEMRKIKNLFPHAKYHIFFAGSSKSVENRWKLSIVQYLYQAAFSMMKDTVCYPNLNALLNNWAYLSLDGLHPTIWGEEELGKAVSTILQGGQLSDYRAMREASLKDFPKITITSKAFLNDMIYLNIRNYDYNSNADSSAETINFIQRMNTKKPIYIRNNDGEYGSFRGTGVNFGEINPDLACFGKGWTDPMITQRADLQLADGTYKVAEIELYIAPRVEDTTVEIQKWVDSKLITEKVNCFLISDYPTDGAERTTPIYPSLLGVFRDHETGKEMTDEFAWVNARLASATIPI